MSKYGFANSRRPEPPKYGTEYTETNKFDQNTARPAALRPGEARLPSAPGPAASSGIANGGQKNWSRTYFLEFVGALIVLRLVAIADADSGGKGLMNPLVLFLFAIAFFTFLARHK